MSMRTSSLPYESGGTSLRRAGPLPTILGVTAGAAGLMVTDELSLRLALTGAAGLALVAVTTSKPKAALFLLVVWLSILGLLRRILGSVSVDPLLLVGPAVLFALALVSTSRGAVRSRKPLSTAVLALQALMVLGAFNPLQGSILAGLTALLFVLTPTVAFWVGRGLADDRVVMKVLALVSLLALPAAAYGLLQTFRGFPSWDSAWIRESGYTALQVGKSTRAFASFSSAAEYAIFLTVGLLGWVWFTFRPVRFPVALGAMALVSTAIWYESARGVIVLLIAALGLGLAARAGWSWLRALASAALIVALLPWAVSVAAPTRHAATPQGDLTAHQVEGLVAPFDERSSTLPKHLSMVGDGLSSALRNPFGQGISVGTRAGSKFGRQGSGTETDPSNVAVALGFPGLVAYGVILVAGFRAAYGLARRRRDSLSVVALGVLVVTFPQWLNGGLYAVAFLPWIILGWCDRTVTNRNDDTLARTPSVLSPSPIPVGRARSRGTRSRTDSATTLAGGTSMRSAW